VAYAILKGETVTGVSIIRIAAGLDSGDVLAQETMDIRSDETAGELEARLAPLGARLTLEVIQRMKAGPIVGVKQDPTLVTKAPKLAKEMGAIDWSQPAASIRCLIRAMQPWPTAYTQYHRPGKEPMRLIVCTPGRILPYEGNEPPGSVIALPGPGMGVVSGSGELLEILEIQPAGKKRMAVKEFLRGYPIQPGCRMGR
jgi:methionyl-tRNA formyltransferase